MATFMLPFDSTGKTYERFQVPQGKCVYLVRAEQASTGTATVCDLNSLTNYTLPDGVTILKTTIQPGADVSLAFMSRSNSNITLIDAEVTYPRE